MEFNFGKSYLFACKAKDLYDSLKNHPLDIDVGIKQSPLPIGRAMVDWSEDFTDMVQASTESYGYITPAAIYGLFVLSDSSGAPVGSVDIFVRLSCFGKSIQTIFQVVQHPAKDGGPPGPRQFLFKNNNAATTFKCER